VNTQEVESRDAVLLAQAGAFLMKRDDLMKEIAEIDEAVLHIRGARGVLENLRQGNEQARVQAEADARNEAAAKAEAETEALMAEAAAKVKAEDTADKARAEKAITDAEDTRTGTQSIVPVGDTPIDPG
jgi:membrane protein involved in colicin uptake